MRTPSHDHDTNQREQPCRLLLSLVGKEDDTFAMSWFWRKVTVAVNQHYTPQNV